MAIKRGSNVKILREESYWFQEVGKVASIATGVKYNLVVKFDKCNYAGISGTAEGIVTNNFGEFEVESI